jgi:serine/threonine protein kinase
MNYSTFTGKAYSTGLKVWITVISKNNDTQTTIAKLREYHSVRHDLDHKHVVRLYNVFEDSAYYIFVEEHIHDQITLDKFIVQNKNLDEDRIKQIIIPLFYTVINMHGLGIMHETLLEKDVFIIPQNVGYKIKIGGIWKKIIKD